MNVGKELLFRLYGGEAGGLVFGNQGFDDIAQLILCGDFIKLTKL